MTFVIINILIAFVISIHASFFLCSRGCIVAVHLFLTLLETTNASNFHNMNRQNHKAFFEKSDLFFLCLLRPLSFDIQIQELEIEAAQVKIFLLRLFFILLLVNLIIQKLANHYMPVDQLTHSSILLPHFHGRLIHKHNEIIWSISSRSGCRSRNTQSKLLSRNMNCWSIFSKLAWQRLTKATPDSHLFK